MGKRAKSVSEMIQKGFLDQVCLKGSTVFEPRPGCSVDACRKPTIHVPSVIPRCILGILRNLMNGYSAGQLVFHILEQQQLVIKRVVKYSVEIHYRVPGE